MKSNQDEIKRELERINKSVSSWAKWRVNIIIISQILLALISAWQLAVVTTVLERFLSCLVMLCATVGLMGTVISYDFNKKFKILFEALRDGE